MEKLEGVLVILTIIVPCFMEKQRSIKMWSRVTVLGNPQASSCTANHWRMLPWKMVLWWVKKD